jgi:hypothetical protein
MKLPIRRHILVPSIVLAGVDRNCKPGILPRLSIKRSRRSRATFVESAKRRRFVGTSLYRVLSPGVDGDSEWSA